MTCCRTCRRTLWLQIRSAPRNAEREILEQMRIEEEYMEHDRVMREQHQQQQKEQSEQLLSLMVNRQESPAPGALVQL